MIFLIYYYLDFTQRFALMGILIFMTVLCRSFPRLFQIIQIEVILKEKLFPFIDHNERDPDGPLLPDGIKDGQGLAVL